MKFIETRDLKVGDKVYWYDSLSISEKRLQTIERIEKGMPGYLHIYFVNDLTGYNFHVLDQLEQSPLN